MDHSTAVICRVLYYKWIKTVHLLIGKFITVTKKYLPGSMKQPEVVVQMQANKVRQWTIQNALLRRCSTSTKNTHK